MSSKTIASPTLPSVVVIPQRFTGREAVVVRRDRIFSLLDRGKEVTLKIAGGNEIDLQLEEESTFEELTALLFGADALRFRALATWIGGPERFNPSAVVGLDRSDRGRGTLTVHLTNGRKFVRPFGVDVESYRRIVDILFGSAAASEIVQWKEPGPSAYQVAERKRKDEWQRRLQAERAKDEAAAEVRRAEFQRTREIDRRYRTLGPDTAA